MNDISTKLLFDGYKSLSSRIDELEFQLKNLRKEFDECTYEDEEIEDHCDYKEICREIGSQILRAIRNV